MVDKLFLLFKTTFEGETIRHDSECVYMSHLFFRLQNRQVIMYINLDARPDITAKASLLGYAFSKQYELEFRFGNVYVAKYDLLGMANDIVLGEEAFQLQKENIANKNDALIYFDSVLRNTEEKDLPRC